MLTKKELLEDLGNLLGIPEQEALALLNTLKDSYDNIIPVVKSISKVCGTYTDLKKLSLLSTKEEIYNAIIIYFEWKRERSKRFLNENGEIKTYVVKTSNLGHDCSIYKVKTNITVQSLFELDLLFGATFRWESTTIKCLEKGAKQLGLLFEVETLIEDSTDWEYCKSIKEDYFAAYGNY